MNKFLSIALGLLADYLPQFKKKDKNLNRTVGLVCLANIIPLLGVFFLSWDPVLVMIIFWFESAIIGIINVAKMLVTGSFLENGEFFVWGMVFSLFPAAFFTVHYGGFTAGQGVFLVMALERMAGIDLSPLHDQFIQYINFNFHSPLDFFDSEFFGALLIILSHLYVFWMSFIKKKEYIEGEVMNYFMRPYGRVVVMQLTIVLGAFTLLVKEVGQFGMFGIFWIAKLILDVRTTMKELNPDPKKKDRKKPKVKQGAMRKSA